MKCLTLWQPWSSLVADGYKQIETRCWSTKYRGPLAIHAAAKLPPKWLGASRHRVDFRNEIAECYNCRRDSDDRSGLHVDDMIAAMPHGKVLCIVNLVDVREIDEYLIAELTDRESLFGNYEYGRYAWHMRLIEKFTVPVEAKGNRMLWNWERPVAHV